jgi:hypothetical protein
MYKETDIGDRVLLYSFRNFNVAYTSQLSESTILLLLIVAN